MFADDFEQWRAIHIGSKPDEHGDDPEGDLAWRAMNAIVERMEDRSGSLHDAASEIGEALKWAAFWLAAGAVIVALILKT